MSRTFHPFASARLVALGLASLTVAAASSASMASAQFSEVDASRIVFVGGFVAGGELELHTEILGVEGSASTDAGTGGVFGLQFEAPIAPFFVLVGRFSGTRYRGDDRSDTHRTFLDFGVSPTASFAIRAGRLQIEPRLGIPLGFTLHVSNEDDTDGLELIGVSRTNPGWHLGVLGGAHFSASNGSGALGRLGGFLELGMMHHGNNDSKYRTNLNQFQMQFGLSFAL
jgi:hypothetical protein